MLKKKKDKSISTLYHPFSFLPTLSPTHTGAPLCCPLSNSFILTPLLTALISLIPPSRDQQPVEGGRGERETGKDRVHNFLTSLMNVVLHLRLTFSKVWWISDLCFHNRQKSGLKQTIYVRKDTCLLSVTIGLWRKDRKT